MYVYVCRCIYVFLSIWDARCSIRDGGGEDACEALKFTSNVVGQLHPKCGGVITPQMWWGNDYTPNMVGQLHPKCGGDTPHVVG